MPLPSAYVLPSAEKRYGQAYTSTMIVDRTGVSSPCFLAPEGGTERIMEIPRIEYLTRWQVVCPGTVDVNPSDTFSVPSIGEGHAKYKVLQLIDLQTWDVSTTMNAIQTYRGDGTFNIPTNAVVSIHRPSDTAEINDLAVSLMPAHAAEILNQEGMTQYTWTMVFDGTLTYPAPDGLPVKQGDTILWSGLRTGKQSIDRAERTLEPLDRMVCFFENRL